MTPLSERVKLANPRPKQTSACTWCGETDCGMTYEEHRVKFTRLLKGTVDRFYTLHPELMPDYWRMG